MVTLEWMAVRHATRILVIDDSRSIREEVRRALEAPPLLASVEEATNGAEGIRKILESDYECVICDYEMPVLDGMAFLRTARQHKNRYELPVILLTSANRESVQLGAYKAGTNDFVAKPISAPLLVARVETHVQLSRMHRDLKRVADIDGLTDLNNRRKFMEEFRIEFARARRTHLPLAFAIADVDYFKKINDTHGHPCGDEVLRQLSEILRDRHRIYDGVGRLGGEEFGLLLPDTPKDGAQIVTERLRAEVEERPFAGTGGDPLTISIGVAMLDENDDDCEALYKRADKALYDAKESGRNRVSFSP